MGKPGSGYMISTPGSPSMVMAANMVGLPPGMIMMRSGVTSTPVVWIVRRTTASRRGRMPGAGV